MAIRIAEVKSARLSDDKREFIVDGSGKFIGDIELKFARECLDPLIDALNFAKSSFGPSATVIPLNVPPAPVPKQNGGADNPDQVRFEIPKNFTITADTSGRGLVLLILNHRMENQSGYALSPDAAKQVAGGLSKSADAVLAQKPSAKPASEGHK